MNNMGMSKFMPTTEAIDLLRLARTILMADFAVAMLFVLDDVETCVVRGSAAQQAAHAIEYAEFARRNEGTLAGRVFSFCSALLWEAEPNAGET